MKPSKITKRSIAQKSRGSRWQEEAQGGELILAATFRAKGGGGELGVGLKRHQSSSSLTRVYSRYWGKDDAGTWNPMREEGVGGAATVPFGGSSSKGSLATKKVRKNS